MQLPASAEKLAVGHDLARPPLQGTTAALWEASSQRRRSSRWVAQVPVPVATLSFEPARCCGRRGHTGGQVPDWLHVALQRHCTSCSAASPRAHSHPSPPRARHSPSQRFYPNFSGRKDSPYCQVLWVQGATRAGKRPTGCMSRCRGTAPLRFAGTCASAGAAAPPPHVPIPTPLLPSPVDLLRPGHLLHHDDTHQRRGHLCVR